MDGVQLGREFLAERDARIFGLKKSGLSNVEIGRRFGLSASSVAAACRRVLVKLNSEAFLSYPEVLRLELERLDELQRGLWPLCQFRREVLDDGSEVVLEPDQGAVKTVLGIMDRRAKLLGMNVERSEVVFSAVEGAGAGVGVVSSLVGVQGGVVVDAVGAARVESLRLLELMGASGVLDAGVVAGILGGVSGGVVDGDVVDADVVEDVSVVSDEFGG